MVGYLLVLLSAAGFGIMPIFALVSYESGVSLATLLFLRFSCAAALFFAYLFLKEKKWKINGKSLLSMFFLGSVLYALQSSFYFTSVKYIPASLAALLLYLYPVFVAILSFFINRERMTKSIIFSIVISMVGMVLVLGSPTDQFNWTGVLLAGGAAITYSIYIVIGNRITLKVPPVVTSAFISLFASLSFLGGGIYSHTLDFQIDPKGWLSILGVILFSTVLAMSAFFTGMNRTGPTKASILSMIEPVITTLFSILLLRETLTFSQTIGGLIVLSGAIMVVLSQEKKETPIAKKSA